MLSELYHVWDGLRGLIRISKHVIKLVLYQVHPVHYGPSRASPTAYQFENSDVDKIKNIQVIYRAQKYWKSSIFFTPNQYGSLRFLLDYRKQNSVTVWYSYPIPSMEKFIESLGDGKLFQTIDQNWGYLHGVVNLRTISQQVQIYSPPLVIPLPPHAFWNQKCTGFITRVIDVILPTSRCKLSLVYLEDLSSFTILLKIITLICDDS